MGKTPSVGEHLKPIADDVGRLVDLHAALVRSELRQSASQAIPAMSRLGVGAGFAAVGGLLGSLAVVHAVHRVTRLPLWGCYGLVGGLLGATGVHLMGSGARQLTDLSLIPRETIATLEEDFEWLKGKTS